MRALGMGFRRGAAALACGAVLLALVGCDPEETPDPVGEPSVTQPTTPGATVDPSGQPSPTGATGTPTVSPGQATSAATSPTATGTAPTGTASTTQSGFVYRSGAALMLDGKRYRFVGFNAYGMSGCENGTAWTRAQLDAYFSQLPPRSMTRTWAFRPWGTAALDQIVASAATHGQKVIFSLADGVNYCNETDGASNGAGSGKLRSWFQGKLDKNTGQTSGYQTNYLPWVRTVVARYKDSPAIGMWELMNEPGHQSSGVTAEEMKNFFDTAAAEIKGIDSKHLVETGALAEYTYGGAANYKYIHSGPNIDVGSLHEYDYDYNNSNVIVSGHFQPTLTAMNALGKPLIIGEAGIDSGTAGCRTSPAARSNVIKQKFDGYLAGGAAGVQIWDRSQLTRNECGYYIGPNDPAIAMLQGYSV